MTPERKLELGLEELRRLIEQARALPGAAMVRPEQARAALVAMAEAALARADRTSARFALDALMTTLPPDHAQRAEVQALRERLSATTTADLLEGLEPAERAMAPSYLLMAAQDGELSAEETAALEDRLASAEAGLRVEWTWLERARAAMSRVALHEPAADAWDRLFAVVRAGAGARAASSAAESVSRLKALRAQGEDQIEPAGPPALPERLSPGPEAPGAAVDDALAEKAASALSRLKALRSGDVGAVRARIAASTSKVSLSDLERKGFREVKVLRAGDINALIFKAVESVLARQVRGGLSEGERGRIVAEARAEIDRQMDAMRELQAESQRVEAERAQVEQARRNLEAKLAEVNRQLEAERQAILRERQGPPAEPPEPGDLAPRTLRAGDLVAAGLHVRASDGPNGDWFDLVERASGGLDVIVGDVSGRGLPAAAAMASARTALLALLHRGVGPADALGATNRALCRTLPRGTFVSSALARCDESGRVVVGSGGHEPAIVYRARERRAERVKLGGVVLGALERGSDLMAERAVDLAPGDALVLVTDGATEACSPGGEPFDAERLLDVVTRHGHLGPEGLVGAIAGEVQAWAGDRPLADDVVVVAVGRPPTDL